MIHDVVSIFSVTKCIGDHVGIKRLDLRIPGSCEDNMYDLVIDGFMGYEFPHQSKFIENLCILGINGEVKSRF